MKPAKKFFKKYQAALIIGAIFLIALAIFIPVRLKESHRDISKKDNVADTIPPVKTPVPDSRKEVDVPILMYHHIRIYNDPNDKIGTNLSVSPENFKQQIKFLKDNGFTTITFAEFLKFPTNTLPSKPVILTFDDGYNDAYTNTYPLLKQNGQVGVFYIISGFLGRSDSLTADQVREMSNNGMEIGSHTIDHPDLTTLNQTKLTNELTGSKSSLEAIIGKSVTSFCYPSGKHNSAVDAAVQNAGYLTATSEHPQISSTSEDKYSLSRIRINPTDSLTVFANKIVK